MMETLWTTLYYLQENFYSLLGTVIFTYAAWRVGSFLWEQQQISAEKRELRRQAQRLIATPALQEEKEKLAQARFNAKRRLEAQMRIARMRQEEEKIAQERATHSQLEQDETARALADWAADEQAEAERVARSNDEEIQAQLHEEIMAIDESLDNWESTQQVGASGYRYHGPALVSGEEMTTSDRQISHTREQLAALLEKTRRESEDLEYVLNKVQTGVDFLPIQVRQTIERWKSVEIGRRITFDELKLKFRYQAYSIDDGLELYYAYDAWIEQQYSFLFQAMTDLGSPPRQEEDLLSVVERAERTEWSKDLAINMEVIASLKEIRSIQEMLTTMKYRLRDLATVCKKRSKQIIEPDWEPKGLL